MERRVNSERERRVNSECSDIFDSIGKNCLDCLIINIKKGIDINKKNIFGDTPLHYIKDDNKELVKILIENGANINEQNNLGNTPLHNSVLFFKSVECVQFFF